MTRLRWWVNFRNSSRQTYRGLLKMEGFIDFFRSATPIDALELSSIGSRPSRRTGQRSLADLRAIPWVFSWTQSRYYLPGWYGIGSALKGLQEIDPAGFDQIRRLAEILPFPAIRADERGNQSLER